MSAGTMIVLTPSINGIDTSDQLTMAEAFQKCFVANGANLKIVDFVNTKLTITATPSVAHKHGTILTQDQTGGKIAYMVVDYTESDKKTVYGFAYYLGGATVFNTSNTVTDAATGGGSDFVPATVSSSPHWRSWTVQATIGTTAYGTMPTRAYLVCRYRNRIVLACNPAEPYQWYMCRAGDPYDWLYAANDAGSPVRGGNGDAGVMGDIIKALIPHKDDYLIFGCAGSMWVLFGDPADGGQLRTLTADTGIFCATAWCWGPEGELYFWGKNGIYRTTIPGVPRLISNSRLPKLVQDENPSNLTHRINMIYDGAHAGIVITITKLSDGTNSNYFYSFAAVEGESQLGGFFPESYPAACGVYSGINYESGDKTLDGTLVGCTDGYIRRFDDDKKSDDGGAADVAINSYVGIGPVSLGDGQRKEGVIEGIDLTVATGVDSSAADSDDVGYKVFTGRTGGDVIKAAKTNTSPKVAGTFKGPGNFKGSSRRQPVSGLYGLIRLENTVLDESWAIETLHLSGKILGRAK
jgi:hypothetical protein